MAEPGEQRDAPSPAPAAAAPDTGALPPLRARLTELAALFLRLGSTCFGGPAAHLSIMEHEVVVRRAWLTRAQYLDLNGVSNLIPGPTSTEVVIHVGRCRAGWPGLLVAGACFILPAMLMVMVLAWAYQHWGRLPATERLLYGIKPVIIAIVALAMARLARTAARSAPLAIIGVGAAIAQILGANPLLTLLCGGLANLAARSARPSATAALAPALPGVSAHAAAGAAGAAGLGAATAAGAASLGGIFLVFLKIGAVIFGSGYVLLAFLHDDLVVSRGWISESQLIDAIAVGQVTPGPVFTTATFIGYLLKGPAGAALATLGIFLPAFILVAITAPFIAPLRRSRIAGACLDGVNVASLGLMVGVVYALGRDALVDFVSAALACGAALLLWRTKLNATWPILAGALVGLARLWLG